MNPIKITSDDTEFRVTCPYREDTNARFKQLGGKWSGTPNGWVFRREVLDLVRLALVEYFGHDDRMTGSADVEIDLEGYFGKGDNELWFAGRQILWRRRRDDAVSYGSDVIHAEGRLDGSSGSMQHPGLGDLDGVKLLVFNVLVDHPDLVNPPAGVKSVKITKRHDEDDAPMEPIAVRLELPGVSRPGSITITEDVESATTWLTILADGTNDVLIGLDAKARSALAARLSVTG